jgi:PTS system mannose-specific IID component
MITGFGRALLRLLAIQGAWNYERLTGIGLGYAAEPLLEDLKAADPARHAEAAVRSAEYFNSHPYLAGVALGALVRAEYDHVDGTQISRLRTALTSPLGALGDQLFWVGVVPATMGFAGAAAALGLGPWPVVALVALYAALRVGTAWWALRLGLRHGVRVGAALSQSWVPRWAPRAGHAGGFAVGLLLPLAAVSLSGGLDPTALGVAGVTAAVGLLAAWQLGPKVTAVRYGLVVLGAAVLLAWGVP